MLNGENINEQNDSDIINMAQLIRNDYSYFSKLNSEYRNSQYLLMVALRCYDGKKNTVNPISYALEGALTEENISLALDKGGIINYYGLLRENVFFHKLNIEKGVIPIAHFLLPEIIKEDDYLMELYMRLCPDEYNNLNTRQKNSPIILKQALLSYKVKENTFNPISYALEVALTEENILLSLRKGNIKIIKDSSLSNCKRFIMEFFKDSYSILQYVFLSDELKSDPEVLQQALLNYNDKKNTVNPICYALEGALTEENIFLSLNKGNIKIIKDSSLSNCKRFIMEFFKDKDNICQYAFLSDELKSDPDILRQALLNYDSNVNRVNPICYALEGALTDENIELALDKGGIEIENDYSISNSRKFIIACLRRGLSLKYENISDELKNDGEIRELANGVVSLGLVSNPVDTESRWSPVGDKQVYKYYQSAMCIMPNGIFEEEEVRGNGELYKGHNDNLEIIINSLSKKFPLNDALIILKNFFREYSEQAELNGDFRNPFIMSLECIKYGIITILIEGENSQIFFPDVITRKQFDILFYMLNNDFIDLNFEYIFRGKIISSNRRDVLENSIPLNNNDVIKFLNNDIEIEDISDFYGIKK